MNHWIYSKLCEARRYRESTNAADWLMWLTISAVLIALAIGKVIL